MLLTARDVTKATALAAELSDLSGAVSGHALDISSDQSVQQIADLIEQRHGHLDILINNATGATRSADPVSKADLADAQQVMETTLFGTWRLIQCALPLLHKSDSGRIVNVSSSAGLHSDPALGLRSKWGGRPAYGIAKAALNALTAKFATELNDTNIKVNAVCPGLTATHPGMAELGAHPASAGAEVVLWAATLDADGPSGGFFRDKELQSW